MFFCWYNWHSHGVQKRSFIHQHHITTTILLRNARRRSAHVEDEFRKLGNLVRIYDGGEPITLILRYRFAFNYFPSFMACEMRIILTNITIVSQKLVAAIPRGDFNKFTYMTRHRTLKEGNIVEKNFVTFHFDIVCLMNDGTHMNIPTYYRPSMVRCLTSIDLIVNICAIKMRCEWGEEERSVAQNLPVRMKEKK